MRQKPGKEELERGEREKKAEEGSCPLRGLTIRLLWQKRKACETKSLRKRIVIYTSEWSDAQRNKRNCV
jgi:hypothetical protein